jgi:hypothetical protein
MHVVCVLSAIELGALGLDNFAIFFGKRANIGIFQYRQYQLRRSTQARALASDDYRAVDENRAYPSPQQLSRADIHSSQ